MAGHLGIWSAEQALWCRSILPLLLRLCVRDSNLLIQCRYVTAFLLAQTYRRRILRHSQITPGHGGCAREWGGSLEGGSPSKFTKIPLPVTCLGAPSPRSQTCPGLKKAFAAFKSKPRINCAF